MTIQQFKEKYPVIMGTKFLSDVDKHTFNDHVEFLKNHTFIFDILTPNQITVLMLRCGFDNGQKHTQYAVGEMLGLSHERIRQLEASAFRRMRNPKCLEWLITYTDETFDKTLLEDIVPDYTAAIKNDILKAIQQDSLKVIDDISIEELSNYFGKSKKTIRELKERIVDAGIYNCSTLIEYLKENSNEDLYLAYVSKKIVLLSLSQLVLNGNLQITSQEINQEHLQHTSKQRRKDDQKKQEMPHVLKNGNADALLIKRIMQNPEKVMLEDLGLSKRSYHYLKENGINTLANLINLEGSFIYFKNLGEKSVDEIKDLLFILGIEYKQNTLIVVSNQNIKYCYGKPKEILIEYLGLTTRPYHYLKEAGINTVQDIINTNGKFANIPNIGKHSKTEIIEKVKDFGVDLQHQSTEHKQKDLHQLLQAPENLMLEDLDLSVRSYRALKDVGINNFQELVDYYRKHKNFKQVPRLGTKCTAELVDLIEELSILANYEEQEKFY